MTGGCGYTPAEHAERAAKLAAYAQESLEFGPGQRSEDMLLQRVWNLAGDVQSLLSVTDALVSRVAEAEKARDEQYERYLAVESKAIFHDDAMARAAEAEKALAHEKIHAAKAFRSALLYAGCGDDAVTIADQFIAAYSLAGGGAVQTGDTDG